MVDRRWRVWFLMLHAVAMMRMMRRAMVVGGAMMVDRPVGPIRRERGCCQKQHHGCDQMNFVHCA